MNIGGPVDLKYDDYGVVKYVVQILDYLLEEAFVELGVALLELAGFVKNFDFIFKDSDVSNNCVELHKGLVLENLNVWGDWNYLVFDC